MIPSLFVCEFWKPCTPSLQVFFYEIFFHISAWCVCVLTLDRYVAIIYPLKYPTLMRRKHVTILLTVAWAFPAVTAPIPLVWKYVTSGRELGGGTEKFFSIANLTVMEMVPCVVVIVAYGRILWTARKHCKWDERQASQVNFNHAVTERRAVRTRPSTLNVTGAVVVLFLLCWALSVYRQVCKAFELGAETDSVIRDASQLLILANSLANPLAYALLKKDIRREVRALLGCRCSGYNPTAGAACEREMRERYRSRASTATSSSVVDV